MSLDHCCLEINRRPAAGKRIPAESATAEVRNGQRIAGREGRIAGKVGKLTARRYSRSRAPE